jgi:ADP-ribose pyrophosphatase YjhB (NUDIX family)
MKKNMIIRFILCVFVWTSVCFAANNPAISFEKRTSSDLKNDDTPHEEKQTKKVVYYTAKNLSDDIPKAHAYAVVIPGKTSASIMIYANHDGKNKIILGGRRGESTWSNFGGKADGTDMTLAHAAAREVFEESMKIYDISQRTLLHQPSHDLIRNSNGPDQLHRMYVMEQKFVELDTFRETRAKQTDHHFQEYDNFIWVDVDVLLKYVGDNISTQNDNNEKQYTLTLGNQESDCQIAISKPLMDMLRQQPVIEWLEKLENNEKLSERHTRSSIGVANIKNEKGDDIYPDAEYWDVHAKKLENLYHITGKRLAVLS